MGTRAREAAVRPASEGGLGEWRPKMPTRRQQRSCEAGPNAASPRCSPGARRPEERRTFCATEIRRLDEVNLGYRRKVSTRGGEGPRLWQEALPNGLTCAGIVEPTATHD